MKINIQITLPSFVASINEGYSTDILATPGGQVTLTD